MTALRPFQAWLAALVLLCWSAVAYIPAVPVNDTSMLNLTDKSSILLRYAPNGVYGVEVCVGSAREGPVMEAERAALGPDRAS